MVCERQACCSGQTTAGLHLGRKCTDTRAPLHPITCPGLPGCQIEPPPPPCHLLLGAGAAMMSLTGLRPLLVPVALGRMEE